MDIYEVKINSSWSEVTEDIFRSWTGLRKMNGKEVHGLVYILGTNRFGSPRQRRECKCCEHAQAERKQGDE